MALGDVADAARIDEEFAYGIEGAFSVEAEVEIFIGEDVDDVVDDGFVDVIGSRTKHLVHDPARHFHHLFSLEGGGGKGK